MRCNTLVVVSERYSYTPQMYNHKTVTNTASICSEVGGGSFNESGNGNGDGYDNDTYFSSGNNYKRRSVTIEFTKYSQLLTGITV